MQYLAMALVLWCQVLALLGSARAEESVEEIRAKTLAAKAQPLKYSSKYISESGPVITTGYRKTRSDGRFVSRAEQQSPLRTRVLIVNGDKAYDLFPEKKTALDVSFDVENITANAQGKNELWSVRRGQAPPELIGTQLHDGVPCYELRWTSELGTWTALIDKSTYLVRRHWSGASSSVDMGVQYTYDLKAELPDSLFELPSGYQVVHIATMPEYGTALRKLFALDKQPPTGEKAPPTIWK